ncbi:MAG: NRDE family protein [Pseudomonadales bacterium]|nr:NRDE family protein [Pseudomonadales bacterium]
MCTVSIYQQDALCIVTMNRDERRNRPEAGLHQAAASDHFPACTYPLDSLSGGTWIGINRAGFTLCLLNRYDPPPQTEAPQPTHWRSRGDIIPQALKTPDSLACNEFLRSLTVENFPGFDLLLIEPGKTRLYRWNRRHYAVTDIESRPWYMLTSSSVASTHCTKRRHKQFLDFTQLADKQIPSPELILSELHCHQFADDKSASIFMERELTHTKSITQVVMHSDGISLNYLPQQTPESMSSLAS